MLLAAPTHPWRRWLERLPSQCAVCHSWPSQRLCNACVARFAPPVARCIHCALRVPEGITPCGECIRHGPLVDQCLAACDYAWPWSEFITRLKFHNEPASALPLARLMRAVPHAEQLLEACDHVVPMPLSPQRLRLRGFNQAHELARRLAPQANTPQLLARIYDTPAQSGLSRSQRLRNLRGALQVEPAHAAQVRGRQILLIDDVVTTGASLAAAAQALRAAGAAGVSALVLARTERAGQPL